jgi:4-hydroxybenzoate polyprenyltransferase
MQDWSKLSYTDFSYQEDTMWFPSGSSLINLSMQIMDDRADQYKAHQRRIKQERMRIALRQTRYLTFVLGVLAFIELNVIAGFIFTNLAWWSALTIAVGIGGIGRIVWHHRERNKKLYNELFLECL